MVYTVYLDVLLILDFIIDYLLLYATGKISGERIKRWRLAVAALAGVLTSLVSLFIGGFLTVLPMIASAVIMVGISYGFKCGKLILIFFGASAAFGGFVFALSCISGGNLTVSLKTLAYATAISYLIMIVAFRKSSMGTTKKEQVHIEIENNRGKAQLYALVDSGNSLCDPITNTPVLIAELQALRELFDSEVYRSLSEFALEDLLLKTGGRFRPIPFKSVGGGGMLPAFKPKSVTVQGKKRDILVAVTRDKVGGNQGYKGIIGPEE